jgi:hypothetical protein
MPQLTLEILKKNTDDFINFQGFLVGNPYGDPFRTPLQFESYYSQSLLAKPLWDKFLEGATKKIVLEQKCDYITDEMFNQFGLGLIRTPWITSLPRQ